MGASSDVALDGYRIELFENESASKANALTIFGFRIGLFISGSIGLYLAVIYPWPIVFLLMGIFLIPGLIVIFLSADDRILPQGRSGEGIKLWFRDNFIYAIHSLFIRKKIFYILLLIGFYKVSDGYLDTMLLPFLDQMGFSKLDVANAKAIGIVTGIAGNFLGVKIIHKFGMHLGLLGAEVFASISNLFFLFLVYFGKSDMLLFILNGTESFFSGISNIVLMSYMSSMCNNKKFTASHFAILTSFSMIFRTLLSCTSGLVVIQAGWQSFFITSALLSIPSLLCIYFLFFRNKRTYL
jgi:PAT family beta-lactamase induction signal transducer AmpG